MPETLEELLAIPYVLDVGPVEEETGEWLCRISYDELPGCVALARSPLDALEEVESLRRAYLEECFERGVAPPAVRPPLRA